MNKIMSLFTVRKILDFRSVGTRINAEGKVVPKTKTFENRITLIGPDNMASITDLKNAQNMAVRRDLKLVKIDDPSMTTRRPVYKLMSNAEYHKEELERRKQQKDAKQNNPIKGEKLLTFSTRIGLNDLMTNVKKMMKLLQKQYEVRVIITTETGENTEKSESMYSTIEKNVKDFGKIVQKRNKGNSLRFQLLPNRDKNTDSKGPDGSDDKQNDKGPL